jgi:hypothetical protein
LIRICFSGSFDTINHSKKQTMKLNKIKKGLLLVLSLCFSIQIGAQSFLKAKERKVYECGHVYKPGILDKVKPMKLVSKLAGNLVTGKSKSDLNESAIVVGYIQGLIPQNQIDYVTKTPGWETCGDAVSVVLFNRTGIGFSGTDGDVFINGEKQEEAGFGSYFKGFSASERGTKEVKITSSTGDNIVLNVEPVAPLEILSINGVDKGGDIKISGKEDIIIELKGGDADPDSELYVEMIVKASGLKVQSHLFPSKATNRIVVPKESLKAFETSPLPIAKKNTISVTRVKHQEKYDTDAGAVQLVSAYSDFTPVLMDGDFAGGSLLTNSFSKSKNTSASDNFKTVEGEYNVGIVKQNPFVFPTTDRMKNIGIGSFVIRGNLYKEKTTTSSKTSYGFQTKTITTTTTTIKKWFPELSDDTWQKLVNTLYDDVADVLKENGTTVVDVNKVTSARAYSSMKPILDTVTKTFVEKGAYGTKRLLTTGGGLASLKEISTTFAADYPNERIIKELGLDGYLAVTFDLDFDITTEQLNPVIKIVAFSPNVTYRMAGKFFEMNFSTEAKSVKEGGKYVQGKPEQAIYNIIKGGEFKNAFRVALQELKKAEAENPAYTKIWENRD